MDERKFRSYCTKRKLDEKAIQTHIEAIRDYESYLKREHKKKDFSQSTLGNFQDYIAHLMKNERNTIDNFAALIRYANAIKKRDAVAYLFGFIEGYGALKKLYETIGRTIGENGRNEIFDGINLPPLGTDPKDKPRIVKKVMERLEATLDKEALREIMSSGLDVGPREWYLPMRKKFLKAKSIDDFLAGKHDEAIKSLEKHLKENSMFFAQEVDKEVIDFVRNNPEVMGGVRRGNIIYETKIPYQTKKYLQEEDETLKRYYACHCGWVREAIRSGLEISPNFCYCSAGYHKRPWDIIFDQPVKVEVLETVLDGGLVCRFAIHIPKQVSETPT
ncbi:MAG: hypothetical protein JSV58_05265 [Candidatus Bathyarchaeota archaeon]|nr:MAG: hypothetical protein JSV58_05265 [Candidatus Bathyarchaeota archaeon]